MKTNFYVETSGTKVLAQTLIDSAKELWKSEGNKVKDLATLDLYYKPEENMCYYVINSENSGKLPL